METLLDKEQEYLTHRKILGKRNSYSKTDHSATFMRMKDDHMQNGQLKPGYNVQFAVNSEFVTGIGIFSNRTDYATLPPLLDEMVQRHGKKYEKVVADSGYESLSNYRYLDEHGQQAYIKPNNYESSRTRKFRKQIGRAENMAYYEPGDYFICKSGRLLPNVGTHIEKAKDGTERMMTVYRCEDCRNCPNRSACCKARDPERRKEVIVCWEHAKYRQASLARITTEEGKLLRVNRSIQAEGSFGQLKHNRGFHRFLMFGKVKITTELFLLALSQNILKLISKCNTGKGKTHFLQPKALLNF